MCQLAMLRHSSIDASQARADCAAAVASHGSNFYWGFRFLNSREREALCVLYAFARKTDDIVDDLDHPIARRQEMIRKWRSQTEMILAGEPVDESILVALGDVAREFSLSHDEILLLIEGCEDDLTVSRYADYAETLQYCRKVAVTVGMLMLEIFGNSAPEARRAMTSLGYGFQLTNILRDIPEDLQRDRIYLPLDELSRSGVTEDDLRSGNMDSGLREFMKSMTDRNEEFYREAEDLYPRLTKRQAKTMKMMAGIYRAILETIRKNDLDVWTQRPSVPISKKLTILARTTLGI